MNSARPVTAPQWDNAVADFLRANPGWLAAHPELYRTLAPPNRVHGEAMADHMAAMLSRERLHAVAMTAQAERILAAGRAAATLLARIQDAVLALMSAKDPLEYVLTELPWLLGADAACLCSQSARLDQSGRLALNRVQAARLEAVLGPRDVLWRPVPQDTVDVYAEAAPLARHEALIRIPDVGVLALAFRAEQASDPAGHQASLRFLGRAVAAALQQ